MANTRIKVALAEKNMKQWQLAKLLKMNEFSLSRKFREELPESEQERIIAVIQSTASEAN